MASATATNYDDLNVDEFTNIDTSLLMAFLEAEDGDDEMFPSTIEITNLESCSETTDDSSEGSLFSEVDELESCSTSPLHHNPDFEWIDNMEMDYEMNGYFIAPFTENMAEFGGLEDYTQTCYGMSMEEDVYIGLWQ